MIEGGGTWSDLILLLNKTLCIQALASGRMDALRALLEEKKKVAASDYGGRKYVKHSEIEGARLKRLREEEATELSQKVRHRRCYQ